MDSGTIVITGGAGFLGSHVVDYFANNNHEVLVIDNLSQGKEANVNKDASLLKKDIRKLEKRDFDDYNPSILIHFAAYLGVEQASNNPLETIDVEFCGTKQILDVIPKRNLGTIFFSSTSEVYGESPSKGSCETDMPIPQSPYAISKLLAEKWITYYSNEHEIENVIIGRYFNTYGERQDERFVVPRFIRNAINDEPLLIHGDGMQTRTFLDVRDATAIAAHLIENVQGKEIFNIGNSELFTIKDLAIIVKRILNSNSPIVNQSYLRTGRDSVYNILYRRALIDKALSVLKRYEFIPIEKGIETLAEAFRNS